MKKSSCFHALAFLLGVLLLSGCAEATTQISSQPIEVIETQPTVISVQETTVTPSIIEPSPEEPTPILAPTTTPEPSPSLIDTATLAPVDIHVVEGDGINHELVFVIRNSGSYSGEAGQPAWLGWGAETFTVAPDGSFWIADDPADPDRLLHYRTQGELIAVISLRLGDQQYYARDIAVDDSGVWVLDYVSQPGVIIHLSQDGSLLGSFEIPEVYATYTQEGNVGPGLWHVPFALGGKVLLDGPVGIVEMTETDGSATFTKVMGYPIRGRVFTEVENGLMIDDFRLGIKYLQPDHFLNYAWLLGVATDGSFYIRVDEVNKDQAKTEPPDQFVRRYSPSGELLGIALLPLGEVRNSNDVAVGSDGNVYAMLSRTDHSVEIQRMRFFTGTAPLLSPITTLPQSSFKPLLPSGEILTRDEDAAREAMLSFFAALAEWRFDDAAALFGGSYDSYTAMDSSISSDQPGMAWQNICQMEFCLPVSDILETRQVASDEFEFLVGFVTDNGIRFDYSICCGNFQPTPVISWFVYSVKVQKVNGNWMVMDGPIPLP